MATTKPRQLLLLRVLPRADLGGHVQDAEVRRDKELPRVRDQHLGRIRASPGAPALIAAARKIKTTNFAA